MKTGERLRTKNENGNIAGKLNPPFLSMNICPRINMTQYMNLPFFLCYVGGLTVWEWYMLGGIILLFKNAYIYGPKMQDSNLIWNSTKTLWSVLKLKGKTAVLNLCIKRRHIGQLWGAHDCSSSPSGGWDRRITWAQEFKFNLGNIVRLHFWNCLTRYFIRGLYRPSFSPYKFTLELNHQIAGTLM